jgi:hypothetical protein
MTKVTKDKQPISPASLPSKMTQATLVYKQMANKANTSRKDVINEFVAKCGLTPAGAATYYNTIKNKLAKTENTPKSAH